MNPQVLSDCPRREIPQRHPQGFLLITALLIITGLATLVTVSLARSGTELGAASRFINVQQAFYLAEAGIDAEMMRLAGRTFTPQDIAKLVNEPEQTVALAGGSYTVDYLDDGDATNTIVVLVVRGTTAGTIHELRPLVGLPVAQADPFRYTVGGNSVVLTGGAVLTGLDRNSNWILEPEERAKMYVYGWVDTRGQNAQVYASEVDFTSPSSLQALYDIWCPDCDNAAVFIPPVTFNLSVPEVPGPTLSLQPYYEEALSQQQAQPSKPHYISQDTILNSGTYEGVIYVERGVSLTIQGNVTIKGTIVSETSTIDVKRNSSLTILSDAPTSLGQAFAPGEAIMGQPYLLFSSSATMDIHGYVMAHHQSPIAASGWIRGGLLGVMSYWENGAWVKGIPGNHPNGPNGPPTSDPIEWGWGEVQLKGSAQVTFEPMPGSCRGCGPQFGPGQPSSSGSSSPEKPALKLWR